MRDIGINLLLIIKSDISSAKAFVGRRGLGNQRHVQTRFLWIQDVGAATTFVVKNVPTADIMSDILTKAIDRQTLHNHLKTRGVVEVQVSHTHKHTILMQR